MKTRTLMLLSVATALAILLAGGVLLLQLSGDSSTIAPSPIGTPVQVGDLEITVHGSTEEGGVVSVDATLGGVDDDLASIRLVTGDRTLEPIAAPADGRCTEITVAEQTCLVEFDVSAATADNRTLVVRRGDDQANWILTALG